MGKMRESRQAQKTASSLDRVNQPEDLRDRALIRRLALERHEEITRGFDVFIRFDQEVVKKFVHVPAWSR